MNRQTDESADSARNAVLQLMKQKEAIEAEIKCFHDILRTNGNVGMHGTLVDGEDFPRNDIDVYQVRHARNKIIRLQNDHKAVMKEIEAGLHNFHSEVKKTGPASTCPFDKSPSR
ncbi:26S proteasome non-ATPase regulatory subunit 9 [Neocloeon triangulifer]|uniref:26S proteasome non-ATPase regulatory subunit 9 n=1 Tax=Neocloeon triangulifer TaxID=2078957 RepID=UPI00286F197F|nr:26S proteasome non-ATPase regulatory subunit 9 [Neocloeon triangulifer]